MTAMLPYMLLIVGFILLIKGADFLVNGASSIARRINVSDLVIGLTIVAFGTSTPKLATSAMAAYKRNVEIAVGNVVGSNIFNIFFVLSASSIIKPLPFKETT
jgi:cation:H+ antiporter